VTVSPVIGAAEKGPRRGCSWLCGCGGSTAVPRPGRPEGCIHPFLYPRLPAGGAWVGSRLAGRVNHKGARAAGPAAVGF
jgi:hypothetical protein